MVLPSERFLRELKDVIKKTVLAANNPITVAFFFTKRSFSPDCLACFELAKLDMLETKDIDKSRT